MTTGVDLDPASPFGVVVPAHDAGATLARALASVTAQTLRPREVVVVDDGSTDDTSAVAAATSGVTLLRGRRGGPGPARNAGMDALAAPWAAFLDADDVWSPDHLATLAQLVAHDPAAGLVSTAHRQVREATAPVGGRRRPVRPRRIDYHRRAARDIGVVWTSAAAVRVDAVRASGGFPAEAAGEDLDLWARIALDHPVIITRRVTARYVRGTGGVMVTTTARARTTASPPPPLHDLSPSVRSMVRALERGDHRASRASIERYIDGRAVAGWRGMLLRGDRARARALARQLHDRWHPAAWPLLLVAVLPGQVARALAALARGARASR